MENSKSCKICLNEKPMNKFVWCEDSDSSSYSDCCVICSRLNLHRCIDCNDIMITTLSIPRCEYCEYNKKLNKKCGICKKTKPVNGLNYERRGGDPDHSSSDQMIPKNKCKLCENKSICRTCGEVRNNDRFYDFRGDPVTGKCKNCYADAHKIKDKPMKKLF